MAPARYDEPTRQAILEGQRSGSMPEWYDSLVERRTSDASKAPQGKARQARNVRSSR